MSLVYDGGTILASKRTSYDDLASVDFDEKKLTERLARQHKLICAAVKAGRINDLKDMTAKTSAATARTKADAGAASSVGDTLQSRHPAITLPVSGAVPPAPVAKAEPAVPRTPLRIAIVEPENVLEALPSEAFEEELVLDAIHIIEDEEIDILPAEAVAVVSELSGKERPANSKLSMELLGDTKFKGGDRGTVNIMLCRGTDRKVVADAQIMIKVLGSSFRPVIFHAKSDTNGLARVHLQLPHFQAGRAAMLRPCDPRRRGDRTAADRHAGLVSSSEFKFEFESATRSKFQISISDLKFPRQSAKLPLWPRFKHSLTAKPAKFPQRSISTICWSFFRCPNNASPSN